MAGRSWGRLYAGTRKHRKITVLRQKHPKHWWAFYLLLELAFEIWDEGKIYLLPNLPFSIQELAKELYIKPAHLSNLLKTMEEIGLIKMADGIIQLTSFGERQFDTDNSTERSRRYRDRRESVGLPRAPRYNAQEVLERDGFACVYCGRTDKLVVDHAIPISLFGSDDARNLVCSCFFCNSGKSGRTPEMAGYSFQNKQAEHRVMEYQKELNLRDTQRPATVASNAPEQNRVQSTPSVISSSEDMTSPPGESSGPGSGKGKGGKKKSDRVLGSYSPDFLTFWDAYPNKRGGKEEAFAIWGRRLKKGTLPPINYLLECLYRLIKDPVWMKEDGKYVPSVTVFLNKGRWTDVEGIKGYKAEGDKPTLKPPDPNCPICKGHPGLMPTQEEGRTGFTPCKCVRR